MSVLYTGAEILLVLALLGLIGAIILVVMTVLHAKNSLVPRAKRMAEMPTRSVKNLVATGKGIAQQETVRFKRIAVVVKGTAGVVAEAAREVKEAAQTVHPSDLKAAAKEAQDALKAVSAISELLRTVTAGRQAAPPV